MRLMFHLGLHQTCVDILARPGTGRADVSVRFVILTICRGRDRIVGTRWTRGNGGRAGPFIVDTLRNGFDAFLAAAVVDIRPTPFRREILLEVSRCELWSTVLVVGLNQRRYCP